MNESVSIHFAKLILMIKSDPTNYPFHINTCFNQQYPILDLSEPIRSTREAAPLIDLCL